MKSSKTIRLMSTIIALCIMIIFTYCLYCQIHEVIIYNDKIRQQIARNDTVCLIILLGQTRAPELTYKSFERHLLNVTQCDFALCLGTNAENPINNPFYENAKYIWIWNETKFNNQAIDDATNWENSFDFIFEETMKQIPLQTELKSNWTQNGWKKTLLSIKLNDDITFLGPVGGQIGSGGIQIFFRQFLYLKMKELDLENKYKWFMYSRSDYKYLCDFPINKLINTNNGDVIDDNIWITKGEECGGVTDRNLLASNKLFMKTLNIGTSLFIDYDEWYQNLNNKQCVNGFNIECILRMYFEFQDIWNKVHFYDGVMYLVRSNNTFTRWSTGQWNEDQQLYIKYPFEYKASDHQCNPQDDNIWGKIKIFLASIIATK